MEVHQSINSQHFLIMTTLWLTCAYSETSVAITGVYDYDYMNGTEYLYICNNGTTATGICGAKPTFVKIRLLC